MKTLIFTSILFLTFSCGISNKIDITKNENFNDVIILSSIVQKEFLNYRNTSINIIDIEKKDSLDRISNHFSSINIESKRNGYCLTYKRIKNDSVTQLTNEELDFAKHIKFIEKTKTTNFECEIWFEFPERFYRIKKIIIYKK